MSTHYLVKESELWADDGDRSVIIGKILRRKLREPIAECLNRTANYPEVFSASRDITTRALSLKESYEIARQALCSSMVELGSVDFLSDGEEAGFTTMGPIVVMAIQYFYRPFARPTLRVVEVVECDSPFQAERLARLLEEGLRHEKVYRALGNYCAAARELLQVT